MKKWLFRIGFGIGVIAVLVAVGVTFLLLGSRPRLSGEARLPGLQAEVSVDRDTMGVPSIHARSRIDAYRAIGYLHAQERYFQMDLFRRTAAGELSALVPGTLAFDQRFRFFQFRERARKVLDSMPDTDRDLLQAYTDGVNAGLNDLTIRPFEYLLLRAAPDPWLPEDSVLVAYSMYLDLEGGRGRKERSLALMADQLPRAVYRFFCRNSTIWESPIDGSSLPILPIPPENDWKFLQDATRPATQAATPAPVSPDTLPAGLLASLGTEPGPDTIRGSNHWVISGRHTADGAPLLAGDPHLGLRIPNIWYRADFHYPDNAGNPLRILGVTLPGVPIVVIGSNTRVAWSFTTMNADTEDLVRLIPDPDNPDAYLTANGSEPIEGVEEVIHPRDGPPQVLKIRRSRFGPIVGEDAAGNPLALLWSGFTDSAFNLAWREADRAMNVYDLRDAAVRQGMPVQNMAAADSTGNILWSPIGWLPARQGYDGFLPVRSDDPSWLWRGKLTPDQYPSIANPPGGRIWNGNNRIVGGAALEIIGDGLPTDQARGWIIQEKLRQIEQATEPDMLELQANNEAVHLQRWHTLMLSVVEEMDPLPGSRLRNVKQILRRWEKAAVPDSVSYRLVREFRAGLRDRVLGRLLGHLKEIDSGFSHNHFPIDEPLWLLVSRQPAFLADPELGGWKAELEFVVEEILEKAYQETENNIYQYTHGAANTLRMQHPLVFALPALARWLAMPATPMDGDSFCVNAQTPDNGPSLRLVVSPGQEADGILTMPGGQSGHPLSPHFSDQHGDWLYDLAGPMLPGDVHKTLRLHP